MSVEFGKISIEPAQKSDITQLTKIMTNAYESLSNLYLNKKLGPPGYNSELAHAEWYVRGDYYKILCNGILIGGFILEYFQEMILLGMMFIDPPYQHKGIGSYALKYIEHLSSNISQIEANTPEWAIQNQQFYIRNGYKHVDSYFDEILGFTLFFYLKHIKK